MTAAELTQFVRSGDLFILTGAGMSTESGIPDYRLPDGTRRTIPMTFQEFCSGAPARQRYWVRSAVGCARFAGAEPNAGHEAVASLQARGLVSRLVTQNVDGLHQRAGSTDVVELHGSLSRVVCVTCGRRTPRADFQGRLQAANPQLPLAGALLADGDAEVAPEAEAAFRLVPCEACGSDLVKPDVVMFGESVDPALVRRTYDDVAGARAVLVLGSSLKVMSGYRFVLDAMKRGQPVALVGLGTMRGEERADLVVREPLGATLSAVCDALSQPADVMA